jgi:hypothetical protein
MQFQHLRRPGLLACFALGLSNKHRVSTRTNPIPSCLGHRVQKLR